eukprot:TRINITY_DN17852_c0_g1_i1.p1 TRINITY_DN17852_c0_g1~~TRINITY_DN17852_c0_g1_i1.p1  ORF type:complete len:606 (-),score=137.21 TRINITY_DN17852_c0_g1_i1:59-1876(-)
MDDLHVCLFDGTDKWLKDFERKPADKIVVTVQADFRDPLSNIVQLISDKFKLKDLYVFQHIELANDQINVNWLNINIPIKEQDVLPSSYIAVHPCSYLYKKSVDSLKNPRIEGWLTKSSQKIDKQTNQKKRWCVLHDNFLYYFKNPTEKAPAGIISVEYYHIHEKKDKEFSLSPATHTHLPSFLLQAETDGECRDWIKAIRERSATGAATKVFGTPLAKVMSRPNNTNLPLILDKSLSFLEKHGLEVEGLFRISASASVIEKYKDEFDLSKDVDLAGVDDPHIVGGLLKLYLRELPEPLLTHSLYDSFLRVLDVQNEVQVTKLKELVQQLPIPNRKVLQQLLGYLSKVAQHSQKNFMGLQNLSVVFGPNLLRPPQNNKTPNTNSFEHSSLINTLTELLISNHDKLFDPIPAVSPPPSPNGPVSFSPAQPRRFPMSASILQKKLSIEGVAALTNQDYKDNPGFLSARRSVNLSAMNDPTNSISQLVSPRKERESSTFLPGQRPPSASSAVWRRPTENENSPPVVARALFNSRSSPVGSAKGRPASTSLAVSPVSPVNSSLPPSNFNTSTKDLASQVADIIARLDEESSTIERLKERVTKLEKIIDG